MQTEQEQRIKNNILIAQFMGYEVKYNKCYSPKYNDGTIAPMQFDRSWDWLMPVVAKCTELNNEFDNQSIAWALLSNSIIDVYDQVVEFIKTNY